MIKDEKKRAILSAVTVVALLIVLLLAAAWVNRTLSYVLLAMYGVMFVYVLCQLGFQYRGPLKLLAVWQMRYFYPVKKRSGEIIFYGANNFAYWHTLEKDILHYKVQNHGFPGADDEKLMKYAPTVLYPYGPKIVVFLTGSNDYRKLTGTDEEKAAVCMKRKKEMFETFHRHLPDAKFLVMSGLLLPGRSEYLELTREINRQLKELCGSVDYLTYVDAEEMTWKDGSFDEDLFDEDQIYLKPEARARWADKYIIPALNRTVMENEFEQLRKGKSIIEKMRR